MFTSAHWALAFINSLETQGAGIEEGIGVLGLFANWATSLHGMVSGDSAGDKVEKLARESMLKTGTETPAAETALRFLVLMVKKNRIRYIGAVMDEAEKILDKRNGVVSALVEYARPPGEDVLSGIKETVKKKTGAAEVKLEGRLNEELVGGFRLFIGDKIIDASVRFQLRELEARLAAGVSGGSGIAGGGN